MNNYQIKDNIDDALYHCFNLMSDIIFFTKFKIRRLVKDNKKFKNIHSGKRCFILGTGPSLNNLTIDEVNKLKSEITFGVNSLYKVDIVQDITPNYYSLFDNLYWNEEKHFYSDIVNKYKNKVPHILTDYRAEEIVKHIGIEKNTIFLYSKKFPVNKINNQLTKNMYIGQNVINVTILVAIYMGFKEIYLLGCDFNSFASTKDEHCYIDEQEQKFNTENLAFYLKFYSIIAKIHYLIAKFARHSNVNVINLTPDSLLDAYPCTDISLILS